MAKKGATFNFGGSFQGSVNSENTINHTVSNLQNSHVVGQQVIAGEPANKHMENEAARIAASSKNAEKRTATVRPTSVQLPSRIPVKSAKSPSTKP